MLIELVLLSIVFAGLVFGYFAELLKRGKDSISIATWKYLSYYTILTNILVFMWLVFKFFLPQTAAGQFALQQNVSAAVTFYIFTVGVANYLLYGWKKLNVIDRIYDLLVHAITPALTFIFWLVFIDKDKLAYGGIPYWLIYPVSYALYTAAHGKWTQFYPYDFTNTELLGTKRVMLNALYLSLVLLACASVFVFVFRQDSVA
jgi:hypothetical protein